MENTNPPAQNRKYRIPENSNRFFAMHTWKQCAVNMRLRTENLWKVHKGFSVLVVAFLLLETWVTYMIKGDVY